MLDRIANVVPYVAFLVALFFVELQLFGVEDAAVGRYLPVVRSNNG